MRFVNFCMMHVGSQNKSPTHEGKYEAYGDRGDEKFEGKHVATADAFRRPWTVMVEILNTIIAEAAMLCEFILSRDDFTFFAEFCATNITKKVKKISSEELTLSL